MINKEKLNDFFRKYEQKITLPNIKICIKVNICFFLLTGCLLFFSKSYSCIAVSFVLLTIISLFCHQSAKQALKRPSNVAAYFLLLAYMILIMDFAMYGMLKLMGTFDALLFLLVIVFEFLCLGIGYIYTYQSIKKGKTRKRQIAALISTAASGTSGFGWYLFLKHSISKMPLQTQSLVVAITFTLCLGMLMFYLGMSYLPMLYFIKKYNMT